MSNQQRTNETREPSAVPDGEREQHRNEDPLFDAEQWNRNSWEQERFDRIPDRCRPRFDRCPVERENLSDEIRSQHYPGNGGVDRRLAFGVPDVVDERAEIEPASHEVPLRPG